MKSLFSVIAILSLIVPSGMTASAQVAALSDSQTLVLSQATTDLTLEEKQTEPVYETQDVPDTCYHEVQHGTREECSTQYDHQCHTTYDNQCNSVPYPVCQNTQQNVCHSVSQPVCQTISRNQCDPVSHPVCGTVPQNVCHNVPSQECHSTSVPVCQSVPRSVCESVQQCTTVNDSVCHGNPQVCQTVPRRQCSPVQSCHTVNDSVCHNETRNSCSTVNRQECSIQNLQQCHTETTQSCHTVPDSVCHNESHQECHLESQQQCHNEYRQECHQVPNEQCQEIPHQVCESVPNYVQESYACTRPVQVQTGETVKYHAVAQVRFVLANFGQTDVSLEKLKVVLASGDVSLSLVDHGSSKVLIRIVKKDQQVKDVSDVEKQVTTVFTLEAISIDQLNSVSQAKIVNPTIYFDRLRFQVQGADFAHLPVAFDQGHLKILMQKTSRRQVIIMDQDFDSVIVTKAGDFYELPFASFNIYPLNTNLHSLEFKLGVKSTLKKEELLNPELLAPTAFQALEDDFTGYPVQFQN